MGRIPTQLTIGQLPEELGNGSLSFLPDWHGTSEGGPQQHTDDGKRASQPWEKRGVKCGTFGAALEIQNGVLQCASCPSLFLIP